MVVVFLFSTLSIKTLITHTLVSYLLWASLTLWFDGAWLGVKMPLLW